MAFVTVGIPFYNEEQHLKEAIESVLRQTVADFELLLVDDGSTDGSLAVARSFERDVRVRLIADGRRRRLPARLNQIVREARGAFVARMDADDLSHPERFARELRRFELDPSLDAVGTWSALIDAERRPFAVSAFAPERSLRVALERGLLVHASIIGRTEWFRAHPYDEALYRAEDRDLWCRTVESSRFDVVTEPLYLVRVLPHGDDFISDYRESQRQNRILFARYGPTAMGLVPTARAYAATFAKSFVMSAAVRFGVADKLVRRRGRLPTAIERALIEEALAVVETGVGR